MIKTLAVVAASVALAVPAAPAQAYTIEHLPARLRTTSSCLDFEPVVTGGHVAATVVTSRGIRYPAYYCASGRTERLMRKRFVRFTVRARIVYEGVFTGRERTWRAVWRDDGLVAEHGVQYQAADGTWIDEYGYSASDATAFYRSDPARYRVVVGAWQPFRYRDEATTVARFSTRIRLVT